MSYSCGDVGWGGSDGPGSDSGVSMGASRGPGVSSDGLRSDSGGPGGVNLFSYFFSKNVFSELSWVHYTCSDLERTSGELTQAV